jgi:RNA-binding protein
MVARTISIRERKLFRAQAHHINPTVIIGQSGLTEAVKKEIDVALKAHELIKIRVFGDEREVRQTCLEEICRDLNAAPVQHIGKLLVIWRPKPVEPEATSASRRSAVRDIVLRLPPKNPSSPFAKPRVKRLRVLPNQRVTKGGLVKRQKVRQSKKEVE